MEHQPEYRIVDTSVDFNDPEQGFEFRRARDTVIVEFMSWQAESIRIIFDDLYMFLFSVANDRAGLPEGAFIELLNSSEIARLRDDMTASREEELHHFVLSTNEGDWCEVVARGYRIERAAPR